MATTFETDLRCITAERKHQWPRPWMTDLHDPLSATCFLVGRNQAKAYDVQAVSQDDHIDALLNRNGQTCRGLYDRLYPGEASPSRANIDRMASWLTDSGLAVLQTNVVCFSTPMSRDLLPDDKMFGQDVFRWLLDRIAPQVIVVHGAGAAKELRRIQTGRIPIVEMPSLAQPAFNKWAKDAQAVMAETARKAVEAVAP